MAKKILLVLTILAAMAVIGAAPAGACGPSTSGGGICSPPPETGP